MLKRETHLSFWGKLTSSFLSPKDRDMQYFKAQDFDVAIVYTNLPFDGILMARALEIPYIFF